MCVLQPEIAEKSIKPYILGFKVVQNHQCWIIRSLSAVIVRVSNKSMSICKR